MDYTKHFKVGDMVIIHYTKDYDSIWDGLKEVVAVSTLGVSVSASGYLKNISGLFPCGYEIPRDEQIRKATSEEIKKFNQELVEHEI